MNKRVTDQNMINSKDFYMEDQGMSMTIGNADFDEREDESLLELKRNNGKK